MEGPYLGGDRADGGPGASRAGGRGPRPGGTRGDHAAQLQGVGLVRPGRPRAGPGHGARLRRRPARQHRLLPERRRREAARGGGRGAREAPGGGARGPARRRPHRDREEGRPARRPGRAQPRRLAPGRARRRAPGGRRRGRARHHRLHLGHDGPPQGRDALAPERAAERPVGPRRHRRLHRRRVPLLPAPVPHVRAHGGLLPHDGGGLAGGLRALHPAPRGGFPDGAAHGDRLRAAHLRTPARHHPCAAAGHHRGKAPPLRIREPHGVGPVPVAAGARAVETRLPSLAVAAGAGRGEAPRAARRAAASRRSAGARRSTRRSRGPSSVWGCRSARATASPRPRPWCR